MDDLFRGGAKTGHNQTWEVSTGHILKPELKTPGTPITDCRAKSGTQGASGWQEEVKELIDSFHMVMMTATARSDGRIDELVSN
jgi:hypothetical protein